ncbi:hypothetical protein Tsubulata_036740 [Turnera subulata]|uniref:Las1-like family protein n=1 Tax=Turnera subulata TaxID=218843 RepID=A0A9Q0IXD8_9ROSI|nr:hypothetical protein Tsubulata_036740 [Turnera subulata]
MESLFGFKEEEITVADDNYEEKSPSAPSTSASSGGYRLVPWLSWQEWESVRDTLFSDSPEEIASALDRVSTWRSRGSLPVVVDVTASIVEIQLKDPRYRKELSGDDVIHSEQMLAMLYCMAILRLVNCVVEKTRKKTEISIAEAAVAIGIPRTLIDIRHEGSHRDLPALALVQDSAVKALNWLRSYYWEPQSEQISLQKNGTASIRQEIKTKFCELVSCLKLKHNSAADPVLAKGSGRGVQLCGRNKLFSLAASKLNSSKNRGSKKHITKSLKGLVGLYTAVSSEVVSVLMDFLLKALASSSFVEDLNQDRIGEGFHSSLDDWKLVMTKLSNKKPDLLLLLLKVVLNMIETQSAMNCETGLHLISSNCGTRMGTGQIEQLSSLFAWLVGRLERRCKDASTDTKVPLLGKNMSHANFMEVLHKCLLVSASVNKDLMDSAIRLAKLIGNSSLIEKLNKLSRLHKDITEENSFQTSSNNLLSQQDESILQATKKLQLIKCHKTRSIVMETTHGTMENSGRWVVAKSWSPCPIGMLPGDLGFSGRLPVLDCDGEKNTVDSSPERNHNWELKQCSVMTEPTCGVSNTGVKASGKREASCDIQLLDGSNVKKMRETIETFESDTQDNGLPQDVKGCLMINGAWKMIGEEELLGIESRVRILV